MRNYKDILFIFFLILISLIPLYTHLHIVEDDFASYQSLADGFYKGIGYCFQLDEMTPGLIGVSGISGRTPLVSILLALFFKIFGHNIFAVFLTYAIPRILILPVLYFLCRQFFGQVASFLTATLVLFFPFFETAGISNLKVNVFIVLFSLISVLFSIKWKKNHNKIYLLITGFFLALNILTKETAVGFSAMLFIILSFKIIKEKIKIIESLTYLTVPIALLIGPFVVFSLINTGRVLPLIQTVGVNLRLFPEVFYKYILTVFYYAGANVSPDKYIINSLIKSFLIMIGAALLLKNRKYEVVLPVISFLAAISVFIVAQPGVLGNRESVSKIALVVPFSAIYMSYALLTISQIIYRKRAYVVHVVLLVVLSFSFIDLYLKEPFAVALDNNPGEFYINAGTVFKNCVQIPFIEYVNMDGKCVASNLNAGNEFLVEKYAIFKSSAFPPYYKKSLVALILIPLVIVFFWENIKKKKVKLS